MSGTTVNASIPMAGGYGPDMGAAMGQGIGNAQQLIGLRQMRQKVESENALRNILGAPGAIDATGQPTSDAMKRVMAVDPAAGMKLQQNSLAAQEHQLRTDVLKTKAFSDKADTINSSYAPILEDYETSLKGGKMTPAQADAAAQEALSKANEGLMQGGFLGPEEAKRLPTKWNPVEMRQRALGYSGYQDWLKQQNADRRLDQQSKKDEETGWQVVTDPGRLDAQGNPTQFTYNPRTHQSKTLDGQPYQPVNIAKPESVTPAAKAEHDAEVIANANIRKKTTELGRPLTPEEEASERQNARNAPKIDLANAKGKDAKLKADVLKDVEADPKFATASPGERSLEVGRRIKKATGGEAGLDPDALDSAANWYRRTHELPAGFGGQKDREAIMNRAAVMDREDNIPTSQRQAAWESAKPDLNSLKRTQLQRDAIVGFERGADREFDLAQSLIPKSPEPLNSQLLTRWVRAGEMQFGDVPNAQFYTALVSALDEYAKVIGGATGSAAASTDSARAQALSIIPPGATTAQIKGVIQTIKKGMDNRRAGYDDTISEIKGRLEGTVAPASAPPASTAPADKSAQTEIQTITHDETGKAAYEQLAPGAEFISDGKRYRKPGAASQQPTSLAPPKSEAAAKPTTDGKAAPKYIEGKVYVDKQGNRAVYKNGQFVDVP